MGEPFLPPPKDCANCMGDGRGNLRRGASQIAPTIAPTPPDRLSSRTGYRAARANRQTGHSASQSNPPICPVPTFLPDPPPDRPPPRCASPLATPPSATAPRAPSTPFPKLARWENRVRSGGLSAAYPFPPPGSRRREPRDKTIPDAVLPPHSKFGCAPPAFRPAA